MTKFNDYLTEIRQTDRQQTETVIKRIQAQSKPWLDAIKKCTPNNRSLWRGIFATNAVVKKSVRQDRRPMTMNSKKHEMFDAAFEKHWGWPARSTALFGSGDSEVAEGYGDTLGLIFPVGPFEILWSAKIDDLITHRATDEQHIDKIVKTKYRTDNLCKALASGNEIMIKAKSYYGISSQLLRRFLVDPTAPEPDADVYDRYRGNLENLGNDFIKKVILK